MTTRIEINPYKTPFALYHEMVLDEVDEGNPTFCAGSSWNPWRASDSATCSTWRSLTNER